MAINEYDLRHVFGRYETTITNEIYRGLRQSYEKFVASVNEKKTKILTTGPEVEWYHAGIGIKKDTLIVIHHTGSLMELAFAFKEQGADDAVLLDSGGSSIIWANWNQGKTIAHNVNYRPHRGAVIVIKNHH